MLLRPCDAAHKPARGHPCSGSPSAWKDYPVLLSQPVPEHSSSIPDIADRSLSISQLLSDVGTAAGWGICRADTALSGTLCL